ncbi:MAG: hypothetical protein K9I37_06170 [Crocinitomicaceae bacterium]|nr:hypothetical protein [Crocinitomicaceae bacterium]
MKTLSFLFFTFLLFNNIYSQGNLQFNQVKLVSAIETVPAGKVWKVTNFLPTPNGNYQFAQIGLAEYLININGVAMNLGRRAYYNSSYGLMDEVRHSGDIWLAAGTTLSVVQNIAHLSVIEFNIVP